LQELYTCNDKPWNNLKNVDKFFKLISAEDEIKYSLINIEKDVLSITFYEYIKLIYTSKLHIKDIDKEDLIQIYVRLDRIITRFILLSTIAKHLIILKNSVEALRLNMEYIKIFKLFGEPISFEDAFNNKAFINDQLFERFSIIIKTIRSTSTYILNEFTTLIKFKEDRLLSTNLDSDYAEMFNLVPNKEVFEKTKNKRHFILGFNLGIYLDTYEKRRVLPEKNSKKTTYIYDADHIGFLLKNYALNILDEIITNETDRKQIETYLEDFILWHFLKCLYKFKNMDYSGITFKDFINYTHEEAMDNFKGEYIAGSTKIGLRVEKTDNLAFIRAKAPLTAETYSKNIHRSVIDCLNYVINENIIQNL